MSPELFWEGEPVLAAAYRKAYQLRLKKENRDMWLQGLYIYSALCDVSPVLHAFAKNGTKPAEYMGEPIALTKDEIRERKERDERRAYEQMKAQLRAWTAAHNAERKKEEVSSDG